MIKFNGDVKVYLGAIKAAKYSTSNAQDDISVEGSSDDGKYSDEAFEVEYESSNDDDRESDDDIEHCTLSENGCSDGEYEDDSEFEDVNRRYEYTQVFDDTVSEATANDKNLKRVAKNGEQSNANKIGDTEFSDTDVEGDEDDTADMISNDSGNEGDSEYNPSDADGDSAADTKVNEYRIIKLV